MEKKDSIDAIHASIDHGISTLDTAPFYGFGLSEELIGRRKKCRAGDQQCRCTEFQSDR